MQGISLIDTAETFTILRQGMVPTQGFRSNPLRGCYLPQNSGITNWDNEFLSRNYVTLSLETHLGKINRISRRGLGRTITFFERERERKRKASNKFARTKFSKYSSFSSSICTYSIKVIFQFRWNSGTIFDYFNFLFNRDSRRLEERGLLGFPIFRLIV